MRAEADLANKIFDLVKEGKTDREIFHLISAIPLSRISHIRVKILGIRNAGRKRRCKKCGDLKAIVSFKNHRRHKEYNEWCIKCRREFGLDQYSRNQPDPSENSMQEQIQCLNCLCSFYTEVVERTSYKTIYRNRLCPTCRNEDNDNDDENDKMGSLHDIEYC